MSSVSALGAAKRIAHREETDEGQNENAELLSEPHLSYRLVDPPAAMAQRKHQLDAALRHHQAGQLDAAVAAYQQLLRQHADYAPAVHLLGVARQQQGELSAAIELLHRAVALAPDRPVYRNNLAVALRTAGRFDDAEFHLRAAIARRPDYSDAHSNLGLVLQQTGHPEQAWNAFRRALQIKPDHRDAIFNLANLQAELGRYGEAIGLYHRALRAWPGDAEVHNNLGTAQMRQQDFGAAADSYRRALSLLPEFCEAHLNLAWALAELGRYQEAQRRFDQVARQRPDQPQWALPSLGLCPPVFDSERKLDEYRSGLHERLNRTLQNPPQLNDRQLEQMGCVPSFNLIFHGRDNRGLMEKFAAVFRPSVARHAPCPSGSKPRIGFLVTRPHQGGFLRTMTGIVQHLDQQKFHPVVLCPAETIAASKSLAGESVEHIALPARYRDAITCVLAAGLDVLYFRKVVSDPLAYSLALSRLAPVVCTSWGTQHTSGIAEVDYYLSSRFSECVDADRHYTERLVRLDGLLAYHRRGAEVAPAERGDFGVPESGALYLCPQRLEKFHPADDFILKRVLEVDPDGHVVMLAGRNDRLLQQVRARLARTLGPLARRLLTLPAQSPANLRRLLSVGDCLLDLPHYGSSLTAYDAFSVDLPIVAMPGRLKVARYALAFYKRMGLEGPLADTPQQFSDLASRFGNDRDFRQYWREQIRTRKEVLFEDPQVVRQHEAFFEWAVQQAKDDSSSTFSET